MIDRRFAAAAQHATPLPNSLNEVTTPIPVLRNLETFNRLIDLYAVVGIAMVKLYPLQFEPGPVATAASKLSVMSSLITVQDELRNWFQSLPGTLRWRDSWLTSSEEQQGLPHQRVWLHGLFVVVFAHRHFD